LIEGSWSSRRDWPIAAMIAALLVGFGVFCANGHSLYVVKDINTNRVVRAYDTQPAPAYLEFQADSPPGRYWGLGLAISTIVPSSPTLFMTIHSSRWIDVLDATTLRILAQVEAPGADDLAGIAVDQHRRLIYAMDRHSPRLHTFEWDPTNRVLTAAGVVLLPGLEHGYGIALDEIHDWLFVADPRTNVVRYYNVADWSEAGHFEVSQPPTGIAVDDKNGWVYTGDVVTPFGGRGLLLRYDLATGVETSVSIPALTGIPTDNVAGIAVDQENSVVYITTGNSLYPASDQIMVFSPSLEFLYSTGDIGNPTGIACGRAAFNLLNFTKQDDLPDGVFTFIGDRLTYTLGYDNLSNAMPVTGVSIVDILPPQLDFVSASGGGVYEPVSRTVTWTIGSLPEGSAGGTLTLIVRVNSNAVPGVTIDNISRIRSTETGPATIHEYSPVTAGPRAIKRAVLNDLRTARLSTSDDEREMLDDAIQHMARSLRFRYWVDDSHLKRSFGEDVFDHEKDAVRHLMELRRYNMKHPRGTTVPPAVLLDAIQRIVGADRFLAAVGIVDAREASGQQRDINKANRHLAKGDQAAEDGDYKEAIEKYFEAWKDAMDATR
jgi:uncharacterized repeat protein (TIGR01451 family)